jgi:putative glutamine amidotransferase
MSEMAKHWVNLCDGVIFSGGEDVDPVFYHEESLPKLNKTKPEEISLK